MPKLFSIFFLLIIICHFSHGQCPNSDFSFGNFNNWDGYWGDFWVPNAHKGFLLNDRHTIIPAPGTLDNNTCNGLNTVLSGASYVAKLGNAGKDAQAEQLQFKITVTPESNLFIYRYAVVLQDPGHNPDQQPSFTIELKDKNDVLIDSLCGYYYVYSQMGMPGWCYCADRDVVWKDWTTVGLNLSEYLGQTVSIVFTTRDCSLGAHFGYAYISTSCAKLQMNVSYCPGSTFAVLSAPPGFTYQWSTGDTTQSIVVSNPVPGVVDSCLLTAVNGCKVTISATLEPTIVNADFSCSGQCAGDPAPFTDLSSVNQNNIAGWEWDFGDASPVLTGTQNPVHIYSNPGTYDVTLISYSTEGCGDTVIKPVTIHPRPVPLVTGPANACAGSASSKYVTDPGKSHYVWTVSDGGIITNGGNTNTVTVQWNNTGAGSVCVNYPNAFGCMASPDACMDVQVNPAPLPTVTECFDTVTVVNAKPFKLKGGIPAGGVYSGPGVNPLTEMFSPSVAGSGLKAVSYTYVYEGSCAGVRTKIINVLPVTSFICGTPYTDTRDGRSYKTVKIGSQCWFAEDLDYGTEIPQNIHQRDNCLTENYHYIVNPSGYHALYQWDEMMNYCDAPGSKGICPPGWHIPDRTEWQLLFSNWTGAAFAGSPLKYSGFSGFAAFLTGESYHLADFRYSGFATFFWTSSSHSVYKAWAHGMNDINPSVSTYPSSRENAFSVRCLKD